MRTKSYLKKVMILGLSALSLSILGIGTLKAQDLNDGLLQQIAQNTANILTKVNDFPTYIIASTNYLATIATNLTDNLLTPDNAKDSPTPDLQSNFSQLGNLLLQNLSTQASLQQQLTSDLLASDQASGKHAPLLYTNDFVYSTVLGAPYLNPDPRNKQGQPPTVSPPYNYIKNAAGINIAHVTPQDAWTGRGINKYLTYYAAVMAIQSFNGYALSNQYSEANQFNTAQQTLITQATSADWFSKVATEYMGAVLRQMLMFQSQIYILLTQLVQTQKQLLTAQVMTNTLLILNGQNTETLLLSNAQGVNPQP